MSVEESTALGRRFIEEVINQKKLGVADEIMTADYMLHVPGAPAPERSLEAWKHFVNIFFVAFPDLYCAPNDLILVAEEDKVAARWTWIGTHQGDFFGIPGTGKQVRGSGSAIYRIAGGKLAEEWMIEDVLGIMQQIGVAPQSEHAGA